MTTETLLMDLARSGQAVVVVMIAIPVLTFAMSLFHGVYGGRSAPWRHLYALVVHLESVVLAAVSVLVFLALRDGGDLADAPIPVALWIVVPLSWLLTVLFVKRAVDFARLRSIRRPFLLLLSWVLAAAGGIAAADFADGRIGVSFLGVVALVTVAAFLVLRALLRVTSRARTR